MVLAGHGLLRASAPAQTLVRLVADLHIHSRFSRACSPQLRPGPLHRWSRLKGVNVLATGDFTHPGWFQELENCLVPAEPGLFVLKPSLARVEDAAVPASCRGLVRFVLGVEISCIYKKGGKVRKVHNLVYAPSLEIARRFNAKLAAIGNIGSDGRPILGLDSKRLFQIALETSEDMHLIPAHAWTPHFAVFGSQSGFDSLEECFDELAPRIFAIETGLSSDPPMNWRIPGLDRLALVSNSDAHSPEKLGREANILDCELSYHGLFKAIRGRAHGGLLKTLEFFPEEGKYHVDGHRACKSRLLPRETAARRGLCPVCGKPVTVGVLSRVETLARRPEGEKPAGATDFESLVALKSVLGQILDVGPASKRVDALYHRLLADFGSELFILREMPLKILESAGHTRLAVALDRMRRGKVSVEPGYDGQYGTVSVLPE